MAHVDSLDAPPEFRPMPWAFMQNMERTFGIKPDPRGHPRNWMRRDGLSVLVSVARQPEDGRCWLHVSATRPDRIPSYEDLCLVKRVFVGADRQALQIFPRAERHVSLHNYCLHLWCCLDGDGLPDFGAHGTI